MGNACDADGIAKEWRDCGVGKESVRYTVKVNLAVASPGNVRFSAGSRPFVAGGIDLEAVLGKYFDEVGVALEWIVA